MLTHHRRPTVDESTSIGLAHGWLLVAQMRVVQACWMATVFQVVVGILGYETQVQ